MNTISLLIVEDSESDYDLCRRILAREGIQARTYRVETEREYRDALTRQPWDVILSDYTLPDFNAPEALRILIGMNLDIPFVVVSGSIGEDAAVAVMRAGAADYVMKDRLMRLPSVVLREVRDSQLRRERQEFENRLRASNEQLEHFFSLALDLLCIADTGGRFLRLNRAWEQMLGYPLAQLENARFLDFVHPDDLSATKEAIGRLAEGGAVFDFVNRYRTASGAWRWIEWRAVCRGGDLIYAAARDMTTRIEAEAELARSQERLELALEGAGLGSWDEHVEDGELYFGPRAARMLGWETGGMPVSRDRLWSQAHPEDLHDFQQAHASLLSDPGNAFEPECRLRTPDGWRWFRIRGKVVEKSASGAPRRIAGTIVDVTRYREAEAEKKTLQEQLLHAQKLEAVGRLAGGIAHDFNNLLTIINGYADLLAGSMTDGDSRLAFVREVRSAGEQAASLTSQLLLFSRRQVSAPRMVDLNELLKQTSRLLGRLLGEDIRVAVQPAARPLVVEVDPGHIQQILMNLAVNSRDAMPDGGDLEISVQPTRRGGVLYAALRVADTGSGIPPEIREHMFEPFFTTKPVGKGTGLGLSTVYGIVRGAGGSIEVASQPGKGAAFTILLPLVGEDAIPTASDSPATLSRGSGAVLVVEDQSQLRKFVAETLKECGYRVVEAASAEEAVAFCHRDCEIGLLVTDIVLPGVRGPELAERLRRRHPGLPVLFMSGYPDMGGNVVERLQGGYLPKPFSAAALAAAVRATLTGRSPRARVLVVDDSVPVCSMLAEVVRGAGHPVRTADSASSARESLAAEPADIALVDLSLGGDDGASLIRELRSRFPNLLLVVMSGLFGSTLPDPARFGADAIIGKPVAPSALLDVIASLPADPPE